MRWRDQQGVALAEWLLASVIGLLILMAAFAWLSSAWQLALAQRQALQMASAGTWALQRIQQRAAMAGFGGLHPVALDDSRLTAWRSANNSGVGTPASDQLTLQFLLDQDELDCEGRRVLAGNVLVERYFMRSDSSAAGWVLACDAGQCDATNCSRLGDAGTAMLADIDSLQVLYGLAASAERASEFVDAAALSALTPMPRVQSLRVGILLHGSDILPHKRRWLAPLDWLGLSLGNVTDARAHRALSLTLELPNG